MVRLFVCAVSYVTTVLSNPIVVNLCCTEWKAPGKPKVLDLQYHEYGPGDVACYSLPFACFDALKGDLLLIKTADG